MQDLKRDKLTTWDYESNTGKRVTQLKYIVDGMLILESFQVIKEYAWKTRKEKNTEMRDIKMDVWSTFYHMFKSIKMY